MEGLVSIPSFALLGGQRRPRPGVNHAPPGRTASVFFTRCPSSVCNDKTKKQCLQTVNTLVERPTCVVVPGFPLFEK